MESNMVKNVNKMVSSNEKNILYQLNILKQFLSDSDGASRA